MDTSQKPVDVVGDQGKFMTLGTSQGAPESERELGLVGGFQRLRVRGLLLGYDWCRVGGVLGRVAGIGISGLPAGGARNGVLAVALGCVLAWCWMVGSGHEHSS